MTLAVGVVRKKLPIPGWGTLRLDPTSVVILPNLTVQQNHAVSVVFTVPVLVKRLSRVVPGAFDLLQVPGLPRLPGPVVEVHVSGRSIRAQRRPESRFRARRKSLDEYTLEKPLGALRGGFREGSPGAGRPRRRLFYLPS